MNKSYLQRGFTLIELLVVIAIIGILSSVVLASLNTARGKAANSSIKSNLAGMRAQGEIIYDSASPNSYAGLCANANVSQALNAAANSLGGTVNTTLGTGGSVTTVTCHVAADGSAWAIESGFKVLDGTNTRFCVDSTGQAKAGTVGLGANAVVCP